ncbi:hypothetical protein JYQ62_13795 [Nostoc sp. UHCC 0702]|nr:hypothetical protein JYQ62_13795 [Nostoc sp. UHCC 0702]
MGRLGSHLHFFGLPTVALVAFERNQTQQIRAFGVGYPRETQPTCVTIIFHAWY